MHTHTIIYHSVVYAKRDDKAGLAVKKKEREEEEEKTQLHCCLGDSEKAEVDPEESDLLLWFNPVFCR